MPFIGDSVLLDGDGDRAAARRRRISCGQRAAGRCKGDRNNSRSGTLLKRKNRIFCTRSNTCAITDARKLRVLFCSMNDATRSGLSPGLHYVHLFLRYPFHLELVAGRIVHFAPEFRRPNAHPSDAVQQGKGWVKYNAESAEDQYRT